MKSKWVIAFLLLVHLANTCESGNWDDMHMSGWGTPAVVFEKNSPRLGPKSKEAKLSQFLLDAHGRMWLFWIYDGKAWASYSMDGSLWSEAKSLSITQTDPIVALSVVYGDDQRFYFVTGLGRSGQTDLFCNSSSDMVLFSPAKLVESNAYRPSLVQSQGKFFLFFVSHFYGGKKVQLQLKKSDAFEEWGPKEEVMTVNNGEFIETIVSKNGKFWSLWSDFGGGANGGGIRISLSTDGKKWGPVSTIRPSVVPPGLVQISSDDVAIIPSNEGGVIVSWMNCNRPFFTASQDGLHWTPNESPIFFRNALFQGPVLTRLCLIQSANGIYFVGYWSSLKGSKILVASLENPMALSLLDAKNKSVESELEDFHRNRTVPFLEWVEEHQKP